MRIEARLRLRLAVLCAVIAVAASGCAYGAPFVPTDPIMPLSQVRPGMKGEARTVMTGTNGYPFQIKSRRRVMRVNASQIKRQDASMPILWAIKRQAINCQQFRNRVSSQFLFMFRNRLHTKLT